MKKILVSILLFVFSLSLVGCEMFCKNHIDENNDYYCDKCGGGLGKTPVIKDRYFKVEVTGSIDSLIDQIPNQIQAGTQYEIKAYTCTDITLHVFINGEEVKMSHFDSDYWGYEFIMPEENITIHLTYDQFYGKDDYTFSDLYYWVDDLDNVDKVAIYSKAYTYERFSEIYYLTNQSDINRMLDILKQPLVKYDSIESDRPQVEKITPIEFRTTIIYYEGEYAYSLNFTNNMLYWNDFSSSQIFKFKDDNYVVPNAALEYDLKTYKFEYDGLSSDVKKIDDDSFVERFFNINSIEFIEHDGGIPGVNPIYYIDSRYGKIVLITSNIFRLNDKYYKVIEGTDYWAYNYCQLGNK